MEKENYNPLNLELKRFMKMYRVKNDMNLSDMSRKLGISISYLSAIENERRAITKEIIEILLEAFEFTEDEKNILKKIVVEKIMKENQKNIDEIELKFLNRGNN